MSGDEIMQMNRPPAAGRTFSGQPGAWLNGVFSDPDFLPEGDVFKEGGAAGPAKVERAGDVTVITLSGGRRHDGDLLAQELDGTTVGLSVCHLLLDLRNVSSLNGRELGALVRLHKGLAASGGRLTLFNVNSWAYEALALTRLDTLLRICREQPPPSSHRGVQVRVLGQAKFREYPL